MKRACAIALSVLAALPVGGCFVAIEMPLLGGDAETDAAPCSPAQIPFQADEMELDGFVVRNSGIDEVDNMILVQRANTGEASMEVDVPCEDDWTLWAYVRWENMEADSFYWSFDDPRSRAVWHVMQQCILSIEPGWYWDQVSRSADSSQCEPVEEDPAVVHLTRGRHTFYLFGREADTAVGLFVLTNDPSYRP
jgi:hypothetical protein